MYAFMISLENYMIKGFNSVLEIKSNLILFVFLILGVLASYYWAVVQVTTFREFLSVNSDLMIFAQITVSVLNSLLTAFAIVFWIAIYKRESIVHSKGGNILEALGAFGVSLLTTGCYACGSLLLPSLGIVSSITTLPFGGLEIKIATTLILMHAVYSLNKKYLGTCDVPSVKYMKIRLNDNKEINLNITFLYNYFSIFVIYFVAGLIVFIPIWFMKTSQIHANKDYVCADTNL